MRLWPPRGQPLGGPCRSCGARGSASGFFGGAGVVIAAMDKGAESGRVRPRFVGFYWTLPMPHVGFTKLPRDAEAAAEASQTIRYQRERVR